MIPKYIEKKDTEVFALTTGVMNARNPGRNVKQHCSKVVSRRQRGITECWKTEERLNDDKCSNAVAYDSVI